jgi:P-type Cu2+ transporter
LTSAHPLSRAIAQLGRDRGVNAIPAQDATTHAGAGVSGTVDGECAALGSGAFMAALGWEIPATWTSAAEEASLTFPRKRGQADDEEAAGVRVSRAPAAEGGNTLVFLGWAGRVRSRITLADKLLPEAIRTTAALRGRGITLMLLSGDNESAVARTARTLGISSWHSQLLPEGKVAALAELTRRCGPVAMVGDGLNDGPVLAAASVGIAVGAAADLARESADIVLPERALESLPWVLGLAARARKSVLANIAWALGYNSIALTLAVAGVLQPVIAAGLMAGSSLLVVTRSLRSHRAGAKPLAPGDTVDPSTALARL